MFPASAQAPVSPAKARAKFLDYGKTSGMAIES